MKIIFCDTTLDREDLKPSMIDAYIFKPAIKRGDLIDLLNIAPSLSEIVIVDGVFDQSPSITHKEIMLMISRGVKIVGISSMGALRAAELYQYGMMGAGEIFQAYINGDIDSDDEVAVSYVERRGVIYKTVPLINIRTTVERCGLESVIIKKSKNIFYKDRSWNRLKIVLSDLEYKKLQTNYIDLKKQDVVNYIETGIIYKSKKVMVKNECYGSLYLYQGVEKAKKRGIIQFILFCIEKNKNHYQVISNENHELYINIAKFIKLNKKHVVIIKNTLQNIKDIHINPKYIKSFKKNIVKELGMFNIKQLYNYLELLGIDKYQLENIFVCLYKMYRVFMHENYSCIMPKSDYDL